MLIRLSIANHLSFSEPMEFSMCATLERQHSERIFRHGKTGLKLVPVAALFGGNASGKSNFYRSVLFLRRLVLSQPQTADEHIPVEPFRLDDGVSESKPTRFVIEILPDKVVYRLSVAVAREGVVEEQLEEIRGERRILIYSRNRAIGTKETNWRIEPLQRRAGSAADREFIAFKTRDTLPNQLLLGALRGKKMPVVDEVTTWFSEQLALMLPDSTFKLLEFNLPKIVGLREFCNDALRSADTGVFEIHPETVSWQDFPAPPELKEEIKKKLGDGEITFVLGSDRRRFSVTCRNGQLHVSRLFTNHKSASGKLVRFELENESEGTLRFMDLLPAFFELVRPGRPKVFIIDELDRSLHSLLTRHLVESYLRLVGPDSRCQLVFTTHDVTLLDQKLLRRDEIWMIEKNPAGMSVLESLGGGGGMRYDRVLQKSYMGGALRGLPRFTGPVFRLRTPADPIQPTPQT